jgi:integrase
LQYEAKFPVGTMARLALDLLSFTGARGSDVVQFGRQHTRDGWLRFTPKKTRKHGTKVAMPICPELAASINATPCGDLAFLLNARGHPFTAKYFGWQFKQWTIEAGLPDNCTAHGVRKAAAVRAAINGATSKQLQAMFGWMSGVEADHYTREAEVARLSSEAVVLLRR